MDLTKLLLSIIGEMKTSEFQKACSNLGLSQDDIKFILDLLEEAGE